MIPVLMHPAAKGSLAGVALVPTIFSVVTIATMTTTMALAYAGSRFSTLGLHRVLQPRPGRVRRPCLQCRHQGGGVGGMLPGIRCARGFGGHLNAQTPKELR